MIGRTICWASYLNHLTAKISNLMLLIIRQMIIILYWALWLVLAPKILLVIFFRSRFLLYIKRKLVQNQHTGPVCVKIGCKTFLDNCYKKLGKWFAIGCAKIQIHQKIGTKTLSKFIAKCLVNICIECTKFKFLNWWNSGKNEKHVVIIWGPPYLLYAKSY